MLVPKRTDGVGMESSIHRTTADDGTALVMVRGEIDFSNADELAETVCAAVTEKSPGAVVVDLGEAAFIDSTGLGALIEGYRAAHEAEIRFRVINPSEIFRRVLTVTGLTELFGLEEHAAEQSQATGA